MKFGKPIASPQQIQKELNIPDDVSKVIEHQVSFFNKLSPNYIVNHYKLGPTDVVCRFRKLDLGIISGKDTFDNKFIVSERCKFIAQLIVDMNDYYGGLIDDLDLIIPFCLSDKSEKPMQHIPALVFSKERYSNNILIPSINNLAGYFEYEGVDFEDKPLFHKSDKMCLAASATNIFWNGHGLKENQRFKVGELAAQNPDRFFCRIMKPYRTDDIEWKAICEEIEKEFPSLYSSNALDTLTDSKIKITDQLRHRFQLCVDGHTCAWARLPWQLRSNSVTIKIRNQHEDFVEWFYYLLDPSKHLLEVDLHNLLEVHDYIKNEPEHQMKLCLAGQEFARTYLSNNLAQRCLLYTLLLLNQKQITHQKEED